MKKECHGNETDIYTSNQNYIWLSCSEEKRWLYNFNEVIKETDSLFQCERNKRGVRHRVLVLLKSNPIECEKGMKYGKGERNREKLETNIKKNVRLRIATNLFFLLCIFLFLFYPEQ